MSLGMATEFCGNFVLGRDRAGRISLAERFAQAAEAGGCKSLISYDDGVIGFGLQGRDNGHKTLMLTTP